MVITKFDHIADSVHNPGSFVDWPKILNYKSCLEKSSKFGDSKNTFHLKQLHSKDCRTKCNTNNILSFDILLTFDGHVKSKLKIFKWKLCYIRNAILCAQWFEVITERDWWRVWMHFVCFYLKVFYGCLTGC